jgi:hypothetical protein
MQSDTEEEHIDLEFLKLLVEEIMHPVTRPRNAFIHFSMKMKDLVSNTQRNKSKRLSRMWKAMTDEQKAPYYEAYRQEQETYQRQVEEYALEDELRADSRGVAMRDPRSRAREKRRGRR